MNKYHRKKKASKISIPKESRQEVKSTCLINFFQPSLSNDFSFYALVVRKNGDIFFLSIGGYYA
jgi:hypothetical protein